MLNRLSILVVVTLLSACGSESTPLDNPVVGFADLTSYSQVSGNALITTNVELGVDIDRVDLLIQGVLDPVATTTEKPFLLEWDSTAVNDGIKTLLVNAWDTEGNVYFGDSLEVIVINRAAAVSFTDGDSGELFIPENYDGTQEVDQMNHWDNPTGMHGLIAIARWDVPERMAPWQVELTAGNGICPHRGVIFGDSEGTTRVISTESPLILQISSETEYPIGQAFVHFKPMDATFHIGESLPYTVKVFISDTAFE